MRSIGSTQAFAIVHFEWDPAKAAANVGKHGVTFDEAATVFLDELAVSGSDPDHLAGDARYITLCYVAFGRLLVVAHTQRSNAYESSVLGV